jgi:hypothetical protein
VGGNSSRETTANARSAGWVGATLRNGQPLNGGTGYSRSKIAYEQNENEETETKTTLADNLQADVV